MGHDPLISRVLHGLIDTACACSRDTASALDRDAHARALADSPALRATLQRCDTSREMRRAVVAHIRDDEWARTLVAEAIARAMLTDVNETARAITALDVQLAKQTVTESAFNVRRSVLLASLVDAAALFNYSRTIAMRQAIQRILASPPQPLNVMAAISAAKPAAA